MGWVPPHRHLLAFLNEGSPPPTATTPHSSSEPRVIRDHVNIDANMVIILAVLLCSLLCALGLNSFVRCALRRTNAHHHHHNHREVGPLGGAYARPASRGLKRSTIRQIPTSIYRVTSGRTTTVNNNVSMSTDCIICLGEFLEGENIKVLPKCKHGFHSKCIDTWLLAHSTCPTCRQSLLDWPGNETIVVSMGFRNNNATDFSRSGAIVNGGDGGRQWH